MRKFPITSIILETVRKVPSSRRNSLPKTVHDFQTWIPGIHYSESFLTVGHEWIRIGRQRLEFDSVEECLLPSLEKIITVNVSDSLRPNTTATLYVQASLKDFISEFHNIQLELRLDFV